MAETDKWALIIGGAFVLLVGYFLGMYLGFDSWASRGAFGDTFNALFAAAAFGGIIWAILLQRKELELQRKELEMTRGELRRSAEAQEVSSEALSRQLQMFQSTAQLNAYSFLAGYYTSGASRMGNVDAEEYVDKIKAVLERVERPERGDDGL